MTPDKLETIYRIDSRPPEHVISGWESWVQGRTYDSLDDAVLEVEIRLDGEEYPALAEREYRIVELKVTETVVCCRNLSKKTMAKL